jgi:putative DNA primase/helicase
VSASEQYRRGEVLEQDASLLRSACNIEVFVDNEIPLTYSEKNENAPSSAEPHTLQLEDTDWPEPEPVGGELPAVPPFNLALLPEALRPLVEDTAERMQVPLDFPAVVAILCLAGVTGRKVTIQPKAADTAWVVVPNLWGGIIAPPGLMKSPVISAITRPLTRIEADRRKEYDSAICEYQRQQEELELSRAAWREQFKKAQKRGEAAPPRPETDLSEPICARMITQDATAEKLHEILRDNPSGVLVIRDELSGWLATLDRPGREGERGFFLSAWNGDTPYTMDRIGRGSIHVDACCVSMLGGIQPARLRGYLADALEDGPQNDGLLQRFQILVYPDIPKEWRYVDRSPKCEAISNAEQVYRRLASLDVTQPRRLRFEPEAQELFVAWLTDLEEKLRGIELHAALVSHLAKYRSLMPSLALLFELADGGMETVSLSHAQQSAACCEYLESHAMRVYSMIISPERQAAAELCRRLANGWKREEGMFTVRDVYRNEWSGLASPDAVRRTLSLLEDAGWVRPADLNVAKGRPSELYVINPKLARRAK